MLGFCTWQLTHLTLAPVGRLGWLLSTAVIGGVLAINVAHKLIHKAGRLEPLLGGIDLAKIGYFSFKIEHLRSHHVHVATPANASSAALGESVYLCHASAVAQSVHGLAAGKRTLATACLPPFPHHNEMLRWLSLWLLMLALAARLCGLHGFDAG